VKVRVNWPIYQSEGDESDDFGHACGPAEFGSFDLIGTDGFFQEKWKYIIYSYPQYKYNKWDEKWKLKVAH
jgi:hypothetical protein